jgi:alkylhydroperoxidase family enzyme
LNVHAPGGEWTNAVSQEASVMARIEPQAYADASEAVRGEWDRQIQEHGRMTNMKRTLAHNGAALHALMEWYPLRDEVRLFLGERLTDLFAHAVSAETDCLICSTFFRRILIERGEDPEHLTLAERERDVLEFGRRLATGGHDVSDALFARLRAWLTPAQIVTLTAFGSLMLATNVVNNALRVDLDEYLERYRAHSGVANGARGPALDP